MSIKRSDILKVAKAVESGVYLDEDCGMNSYDRCRYCKASRYHDWKEWTEFKHEDDCVTVIAQKLINDLEG